jgi:hypothetical protein
MYVLVRTKDSKFVNKAGRKNSYTSNLQNARIFETDKHAEINCCSNEHIIAVANILN